MSFDPSRRSPLTLHDLPRFTGDSLFNRLARALCPAECVPRKELYEAWEVACRVRRRVRGGRVIDLACGHGLLAHVMLLIDATSERAIAVDVALPPSAAAIADVLVAAWPRLEGRVTRLEGRLEDVTSARGDVVVSAHACGTLTDRTIDCAIAGRAHVAVLPCCQVLDGADDGGLRGWLDGPLAIDVRRATRLSAHGYSVHTVAIPAAITPKNRLLIGIAPKP
ncbi:MAG: methyltransferase [Polyangiales bacterium]